MGHRARWASYTSPFGSTADELQSVMTPSGRGLPGRRRLWRVYKGPAPSGKSPQGGSLGGDVQGQAPAFPERGTQDNGARDCKEFSGNQKAFKGFHPGKDTEFCQKGLAHIPGLGNAVPLSFSGDLEGLWAVVTRSVPNNRGRPPCSYTPRGCLRLFAARNGNLTSVQDRVLSAAPLPCLFSV